MSGTFSLSIASWNLQCCSRVGVALPFVGCWVRHDRCRFRVRKFWGLVGTFVGIWFTIASIFLLFCLNKTTPLPYNLQLKTPLFCYRGFCLFVCRDYHQKCYCFGGISFRWSLGASGVSWWKDIFRVRWLYQDTCDDHTRSFCVQHIEIQQQQEQYLRLTMWGNNAYPYLNNS